MRGQFFALVTAVFSALFETHGRVVKKYGQNKQKQKNIAQINLRIAEQIWLFTQRFLTAIDKLK